MVVGGLGKHILCVRRLGIVLRSRYDIGEREALDLETKLDVLRRVSKTQKAVHLTMVTAHGLTENPNGQCVQSTVTLDDLFM